MATKRVQRRAVAPEAVVKDRCYMFDDERREPLSSRRSVIAGGLDELAGLALSAAHGGDPQRKVGLGRGAGRLAGRADLVEQRLGGG